MSRFTVVQIFVAIFMMSVIVHAGQFPKIAPSFTLYDVHGKSVSFEEFRGRVVFLTFWAVWCIPCREELPELDRLYQKYKKEGFEVIAVSVDSSEAAVENFLRKIPVSFTVLLDKKSNVNDDYGVSGLPIGFIIGKDGNIRFIHKGFGKEFLPLYEKEIADLIKQ